LLFIANSNLILCHNVCSIVSYCAYVSGSISCMICGIVFYTLRIQHVACKPAYRSRDFIYRPIQRAQLSQRGRATVSVVETLKRSLGATQGGWKWYKSKASLRFPIRFHSNRGPIFSGFDTIHERDGHGDTSKPPSQTDTIRQLTRASAASLGCIRAAKMMCSRLLLRP